MLQKAWFNVFFSELLGEERGKGAGGGTPCCKNLIRTIEVGHFANTALQSRTTLYHISEWG